jgi:hypothetical protein
MWSLGLRGLHHHMLSRVGPGRGFQSEKTWKHTFHGKASLLGLRRTLTDTTTGSHKCGNGQSGGKSGVPARCLNLFCMIWEPQTENGARVACHTRFTEQAGAGVDEPEMACFCAAGMEIPCTVGRSDQTFFNSATSSLDTSNHSRQTRREEQSQESTWQMPVRGLWL